MASFDSHGVRLALVTDATNLDKTDPSGYRLTLSLPLDGGVVALNYMELAEAMRLGAGIITSVADTVVMNHLRQQIDDEDMGAVLAALLDLGVIDTLAEGHPFFDLLQKKMNAVGIALVAIPGGADVDRKEEPEED
jgi:hypothetical protein